jgi:hypothetical protein
MHDREPTPPADPRVEPGDGVPARPDGTGPTDGHEADEALVRPFVITGGRTRHATVHLRVETLVVGTGLEPRGAIQFEHAAILDACRQPVSVAEVAARIGVPLGVAQILVGDLADAGLVRVHAATPNATPSLLMRMIDAVRAL